MGPPETFELGELYRVGDTIIAPPRQPSWTERWLIRLGLRKPPGPRRFVVVSSYASDAILTVRPE